MHAVSRRRAALWALLALTLLAGACSGTAPRAPVGVMDTPEHHFTTGVSFLDKGADANVAAKAGRSFDTALELDPGYGPALAGKGVVLALGGEAESALELVDKGLDEAGEGREELWTLATAMRAHTALARQGLEPRERMLAVTADLYEDGLDVLADDKQGALRRLEPPLLFQRAEALLAGFEFQKAADLYARILSLEEGMEARADARWRFVQRVMRAAPRTSVGKQVALMDTVSRADMAALLVEELGVERFFAGTAKTGSGYAPPSKTARVAEAVPGDIAAHPLVADIEQVLSFGLRGLMPYPDGLFLPARPVARAEMAMVFEDIVAQATNDRGVYTRFIGQTSPFTDLRADHASFNAAMLSAAHGLLQADLRGGRFRPADPVSGVDAVLAVNTLRDELHNF